MRTVSILAAGLVCLLAAARPGEAQQGDTAPVRLQATRPALEQLQLALDQAAQAPDSSAEARARAVYRAAEVRERLTAGDFRPGDRVLLEVEGGTPAERPQPGAPRPVEQQLSDTFTVGPNRELTLPVIGALSLRGVLRSELEGHVTRELSRFIKDPVVHARSLIRLSVVGAVAKAGFYAVPADAVVSDALMVAGGLTPDAKFDKLRIDRAGNRLWDGKGLQDAVAERRTLDELGLRDGDQFVVPARGRSTTFETVRTVSVLLSIPLTIYALTKIGK